LSGFSGGNGKRDMKCQHQPQDVSCVVDFVEVDSRAVWSSVHQVFFVKMVFAVLIAQLELR